VSGGVEAAGDVMTGAVMARAIEPDHGTTRAEAHGPCLNCGTALLGSHCHVCGQSAHVHRTLQAYGHDLLHGVFHFEGKIWNTLPLLAFKPGELTRRYIHGERAKFVSPLALFLFAVFLMFAVVGGLAGEMHAPEVPSDLRNKSQAELSKALGQARAATKQLDARVSAVEKAGGDSKALEKAAKDARARVDAIETAQALGSGKSQFTVNEVHTGWVKLDAAVAKANANPNLFLYKIQSGAYKYAWALIPLSVPFVWLLFFWRRQYKLYDHAIFVTYSLTFMLFLVVALSIVGFVGVPEPVVPLAGTFVPPLHIYRHLRGAYGVSRAGGLLRTLLLGVFGAVVLIAFLILLLALGAF